MLSFVMSALITALVSFIFAFFVLLKNKKSKVNQFWFAVCFSVFIWEIGLFLELTAHSVTQALFYNKILYVGAILIPIFYFNFVVALLNIAKKKKRYIIVGYGLAFVFIVLNLFTKWFVSGVPPMFEFKYWVEPSYFYYPYFVYFVLYFTFSFSSLIQELKTQDALRRQQIKYVLLSGLFGVGGGITVFFPQFFNIYPFGNYFVILYIIIVAYAIVKHRLMDIRFVLRRYSVYTISLLSIILPAIVIKNIINNTFAITVDWVDYLVLIVAITFFPTIRDYYYRLANKYFFSSLYDAQAVIAGLSDKLSSTLLTQNIYRYINESLADSLHARSVGIFIFDESQRQYQVKHYFGDKKNEFSKFIEDKGFYTQYLKTNSPVIVEDIKKEVYVKYRKTVDLLTANEIEVLIPLKLRDKTIGLITLGIKESKDIYNDEDLALLEIIGAQSAIAIENALQYEEIKNFSQKLEKEVEIATYDLRAANQKLQQLDQAKSEFISIASHQLRTPLTVIKGYLSMLRDGNFGKLSRPQADSLQRVYESNERLIRLVENLLNISRIESGRLQPDYQVLRIEDLVGSVVEELKTAAKRKEIKLTFRKPSKRLAVVTIDEEKIRQAIMNLIDNAIKYTFRGGKVKVSVSKEGDYVKFCVADSGLGVSQAELPNLFKKFSRGTKTPLLNTEGTGLGLYVAKQMVDLHKGKIWVESEGRDKGSQFYFLIPINK